MQSLGFLFSPSGRLQPRAFVFAAGAVYAAELASQWLTAPAVTARAWLWPFLIVQAVLLWIWFALHASRLRDGGRSIGLAAGASVLYALSLVLLLIIATAFAGGSGTQPNDPNATGALTLILLVWIVAILSGSHSFDFIWVIVAILTVMALLPIVVAFAVTLWAATRPRSA
jgi:hypothetical protein